MDNAKLEKVTDQLHTVDANLTGLKILLKILMSFEKMSNVVALKTLQQQVTKL